MDILELKRQHEGLSDDEIMRVWADKDGLTEIAFSALREEIEKRQLGGQQFETRTAELRQELTNNKQRFERHQTRVVWKTVIYFAILGIGILIALVRAFLK